MAKSCVLHLNMEAVEEKKEANYNNIKSKSVSMEHLCT